MRQSVVQNQVARAKQVADRRLVGRMAPDVDDRVFRTDQAGDGHFQLAMNGLFARHQAAGRHRRAEAVDGVFGGLSHRRIARHANVVVAGKVDQLATADHRRVVGHSLVNVEVGIADARMLEHFEVLLQP